MRKLIVLCFVIIFFICHGIAEEIYVHSQNENGVKYEILETGTYRIKIIDGAFTICPVDNQDCSGWWVWLVGYKNRNITRHLVAPDQYNCDFGDFQVGEYKSFKSFEEAESAAKNYFVDLPLNKSDYLIFVVDDGITGTGDTSNYKNNVGGLSLDISRLNQPQSTITPISTSTLMPPTLPITTIPTSHISADATLHFFGLIIAALIGLAGVLYVQRYRKENDRNKKDDNSKDDKKSEK